MRKQATKPQPWTDAELAALRDMAARGVCRKAAAVALKRPYNCVRTTAYRLGIEFEHECGWSAEEDQYLRDHYRWQSAREISEKLGRDEHAIWRRARKLKLRKNRRASHDAARMIESMPHESTQAIMRQTGMSRGQAHYWKNKINGRNKVVAA